MSDFNSTANFRADIANFRAGIQQAQRQIRLAASEFDRAAAGLDDWSNSAEGLQRKVEQLSTTLEAQRRIAQNARDVWERTVAVYGENSAEADRARMAMNRYETQVIQTERDLQNYQNELADCEAGTGRFADATEELEEVTADTSEGFTVMKAALAELVADGIRLAIDAIKDFAQATIQAGMDFEQGMAQVGAISGATTEELELLEEKAKEMGATTKFSATESAEAFNYMAMAGWETEDMLNGIEGIMNLAAASGEDLATTSDIVTDALTAMGYSAGDAGKLADVMAAASSSANTNVSLMGKTFQYAAPLVGALGYSMEDTAVQIGLMANAGIKGEKAGTVLRSILNRLSAPPKECAEAMEQLGLSLTDSEGNMKSLDEVMTDMREAFAGLSETEQTATAKHIAGAEAMSGLLAIVNAAPADYQKLTKAVKESGGAAADMAETMNDTVEGQLTLLKSQIEGIQIEIYSKLAPALRDGLQKVDETLTKIDLDKASETVGNFAQKTIEIFAWIIDNGDGVVDVLKAVGTVLLATFAVNKMVAFGTAISGMINTIRTLTTATQGATVAQQLLNAAQLATPVGLVTAAVAGLAAGMIYLASKTKEYQEIEASLTEQEKANIEQIKEKKKAYDDMKAARDENVAGIRSQYAYYRELSDELGRLVDANGEVAKADQDRANYIITTLNEALGTEMSLIDGVIQNYRDEKAAIEELITTKKAEAVLNANEQLYNEAIKGKSDALKELTETSELYDGKLKAFKTDQEAYAKAMNTTAKEYAKAHDLGENLALASQQLTREQDALRTKYMASGLALSEASKGMTAARDTYTGYISTIKNYEGVSSAVISGDSQKISDALSKLEYDFKTAETANRQTLEQQLKDYKENLASIEEAIRTKTPGITEEERKQAESMVTAARQELQKLPPEADKLGTKAGENAANGLRSTRSKNAQAGTDLKNAAVTSLTDKGEFAQTGKASGMNYSSGILSEKGKAQEDAKQVAFAARSGLGSAKSDDLGKDFAQGYINGIRSMFKQIFNVGREAAGQAEGGIKTRQDSNSPSKVTYKLGLDFVAGYVNAISGSTLSLQKAVQSMVGTVVKELSSASWDFTTLGDNASESFSKAISKNLNLILSKMSYDNEQKLKTFDKTIEAYSAQSSAATEKLQADSDAKIKEIERKRDDEVEKRQNKINELGDSEKDKKKKEKLEDKIKNIKDNAEKEINAEKDATKKKIAASEKNYNNLIQLENDRKEAYERASSEMISAYTEAMNEYQSKAQQLIDETIGGITSTYTQRYNELINKQDNLIQKLLSAGQLFEVSGAGIMTISDLTEQTKQIREYTNSLMAIKDKVSAELFDEIVSFDEKEGKAYLDRLLGMSADELEAYNQAYTEKLKAAQESATMIYRKDFEDTQLDYYNAIEKAFENIPELLRRIGNESMNEFLTGFTENTSFMSQEIQTYVEAMVDEFRQDLGLDKTRITKITRGLNSQTSAGNVITNNYNLVQNNTSPKALTALETYQARRQQIAMAKAVTGNV